MQMAVRGFATEKKTNPERLFTTNFEHYEKLINETLYECKLYTVIEQYSTTRP
jgi:hypothetical protein